MRRWPSSAISKPPGRGARTARARATARRARVHHRRGGPWAPALTGIEAYPSLDILYWLHLSRRDLILQNPNHGDSRAGHLQPALADPAQSDRPVHRPADPARGQPPDRARPRMRLGHAADRHQARPLPLHAVPIDASCLFHLAEWLLSAPTAHRPLRLPARCGPPPLPWSVPCSWSSPSPACAPRSRRSRCSAPVPWPGPPRAGCRGRAAWW
jgi:hypothetical protein